MATRHGAQPPSAEPFVALGEGPVTGLFVGVVELVCRMFNENMVFCLLC